MVAAQCPSGRIGHSAISIPGSRFPDSRSRYNGFRPYFRARPYNDKFMLRPFRGQWPQLDASVYVDQSAQVIGDVVIGPESSVWMNCVVRGDVHQIRIGARSNVQDGTVVHVMRGTHATHIGDEVTIGHGALIHGCTIENRVL